MVDNRMTPEEKLLKIIEGPVPVKPPVQHLAGQQKLNSILDSFKKKFKGFRFDAASLKSPDLVKINKAVIVLCAVFTVFLLFYFVSEGFALRSRFNKVKAEVLTLTGDEGVLPSLDVNISDLITSASKRNIFTLEVPAQPANLQPTEAGETSGENSLNLKLVGIIWSDSPQAMLEDTKEQKTYLVSAGDNVGALKVNKILSNKVIIGKGQQEWELR